MSSGGINIQIAALVRGGITALINTLIVSSTSATNARSTDIVGGILKRFDHADCNIWRKRPYHCYDSKLCTFVTTTHHRSRQVGCLTDQKPNPP